MPTIDFEDLFDNAVDEGFGPSEDLTPGKYKGQIVSANWGTSKAGDPKAGFLFKADPDSTNADGEDVSGDTLWLNATFSKAAKDFAARDLKALGITGAMLNADPKAAVQTAVGQRWSFEVKLSKDGEWTNLYLGKRQDADAADEAPKPKARKPKAAPKPEPDEDQHDTDDWDEDSDGEDVWDI